LFKRFLEQYNTGDLVNAENSLHLFLELKVPLTQEQLIAVYNNLGAIELSLGKYDQALEYNFKAESFVHNKDPNSLYLADIFNNRGNIYEIKKSYDVAIEYLEKSIRIYKKIGSQERKALTSLSSAYINISVALIETKNYFLALNFLEHNVKLNSRYKLSGLSLTYLNIAKTYVKLENSLKAEEYYSRSIKSFVDEHNEDYFRLAEVYFDYGLYLRSEGKLTDAREAHERALAICLKNYGIQHTLTSLSFKHIADDYIYLNKIDSALFFYQKSLISVGKDFNNPDIFTNPSIDSSLFDIRLLDNLKSKAIALEMYSGTLTAPEMKLKIMNASLATVELALQLIDRIRNNYMSEESRIYLAENEKETYLFAAHLAYSLFTATNDKSLGQKMYEIAQKAKAAILRNEITGNELLYSAGMPDSLRQKQNRLSINIAAYNNMILEENRKLNPDSSKIALWKDALFDMNREKENVTGNIEKAFPQYHDLIRKTEPVPLQNIQKYLKKDETIVDFLLSNQYTDGKRKLYVFLITLNSLDFRELWLDSLFVKNAGIIRGTTSPSGSVGSQKTSFEAYTGALNYLYSNLVKPVEPLFKGNKLIIIPDEEIGWLPFDAFLKEAPHSDQSDYEGLHYLINDYTISYAYSSSLIFNKTRTIGGAKVFAFSPDYSNASLSGTSVSSLQGTGLEIASIYNNFRGRSFSGENATKTNFISSLKAPSVIHLAMHSMTDSANSRYSYLMFDSHNLSDQDSRLYNYEISLTRINSPMVVLSACNSGTGTLYYGEGLMSLARGFTLAGAASVIKTAWEINDETSAPIITQFYNYLSKGKSKNDAMRLAKLDYLKKSSPAFKNPYYWAAYEVLGDNSPIARNAPGYLILITLFVILSVGGLLFYLRRRRIFSERSR
jgi:CHAT domain-containing protein